MRPIVGIPTQNLQSIGGVPADLPPSWIMSHRYVRALTTGASAVTPWLVPALDDDVATLRAIFDELDGIFLPGGADIEPATYGAERHPMCDRSDPARDRVEIQLVRWAVAERKPVLGVCRGLQIINLAAGGTLVQDIAALRPESIKHDYFPFRDGYARDHLAHTVGLDRRSRLASIIGASELAVNSMHHQAIERLAPSLLASAVAPDGVIEGVEGRDDSFLIGVQWHPEVLVDTDERTRRLFQAFIIAATAFRESRGAVDSLR
jgi:putative glutamine amidotransferase